MNNFKIEQLEKMEGENYILNIPCIKITELKEQKELIRYFYCAPSIFFCVFNSNNPEIELTDEEELDMKDVLLFSTENYCPDEINFGTCHKRWLFAWKNLIKIGVVEMKKQWKCLEENYE